MSGPRLRDLAPIGRWGVMVVVVLAIAAASTGAAGAELGRPAGRGEEDAAPSGSGGAGWGEEPAEDEELSAEGEEPAAEDEETPEEGEEPQAEDEEAPGEGEEPAGEDEEAPGEGEEPSAEGEEPGEGGETEGEPGLRLPTRLERFVPDDARPEVKVTVVCDEACMLTVDGVWKAELEASESAEIEVRTGPRKFRAASREVAGVEWSSVVEVREDRSRPVRTRLGRAIRDKRRQERQQGVYVDEKSGLMWTRRDNGTDLTWAAAGRYCEESRFAGFEDWRLPSMEELDGLHNIWSQATYKIVGSILLTGCCPWSSEIDPGGRAWNFNFQHRQRFAVHPSFSLGLRALCVRPAGVDEDAVPAASQGTEAVARAGDAAPEEGAPAAPEPSPPGGDADAEPADPGPPDEPSTPDPPPAR